VQKILTTTEQTTETQLEQLIKNTPKKVNIVKVTFNSGLIKYVEKKDFASYYHHVSVKAELGSGIIKNNKIKNFKTVGWENTFEHKPHEEMNTKAAKSKLQYPEKDSIAYRVWKIIEGLTNKRTSDTNEEVVIAACKVIDIAKGTAKIQYKKWLKYMDSIKPKPKKKMAKKVAKKKPGRPAKKKPGRPAKKKKVVKSKPAKKVAVKKKPAKKKAVKKVSTKKTVEKKIVTKKATGKRGRPPKKEAANRKLATRPQGSESYYKPSSNTSIV